MILTWTLACGIIVISIGVLLLVAALINILEYKSFLGPKFYVLVIFACIAVTIICYGIKLVRDDLKSQHKIEVKIEKVFTETKDNTK
jgi:hypothetical protein